MTRLPLRKDWYQPISTRTGLDLTVRKQILWESETATDAEVRAMEVRLIRETSANDPAICYNVWPRFSRSGSHIT
jgi:hypothetical protein